MIMFLLGVSTTLNAILLFGVLVLYKSHKMKQFIKNTVDRDKEVWDW